MQVHLSGDEMEAIERWHLLGSIRPNPGRGAAIREAKVALELTEDEADDLREACVEQQQVAGFDEGYRLTPLGQTLQGLINKLDS